MDILSTILDLHLTDDDEFGSQNGLNIAVAFTAYDNETEWSLDPTVGELVFNSFSWGPVEDSPGEFFTSRDRLPVHNCSRDELGLGNDRSKSRFFEIHESAFNFIDAYANKFLCIEQEDTYIYGDYNTQKARQLNIQLIKCRNRPDCKSEAEITEALRNKFLLIFFN